MTEITNGQECSGYVYMVMYETAINERFFINERKCIFIFQYKIKYSIIKVMGFFLTPIHKL